MQHAICRKSRETIGKTPRNLTPFQPANISKYNFNKQAKFIIIDKLVNLHGHKEALR